MDKRNGSENWDEIENKLWENLHPYLEEKKPCIVCKGTNFTSFAKQRYLDALECQECFMISVNPHFSSKGLELLYSQYYSNKRTIDSKIKDDRKITYQIDKKFVENFVSSGSVLDIGCSGGEFLSVFEKDKWDREGVEIDPYAAEMAFKNYGIHVRVGHFIEMQIGKKYDLIMLRGVIEHFSDPINVLKKCSELLKPDGFLFITATPLGDSFAFNVYREKWVLFSALEHIHYFSLKHLNEIMGKFSLKYISHNLQYIETPYANYKEDYRKIIEDIIKINSGNGLDVKKSVPFPGSMLSCVWQKS